MEPKDEVKQRLDVVDIVSEHLPLKPAGSGSFKALCPFHSEKTPSLHVSREKQIWHCFGCNKGGDVFSFLMELEGLSFPEALKQLATKAGVKLPEYRPDKHADEKDELISLHALAGKFYEKVLHEHELGEEARTYLKNRGISVELAKKFRLGFAPDKWEALTTFLQKRGCSDDLLLTSGLSKKSSKGNLIDRFRKRLLVPLCDMNGRILGFTGRLVEPEGEKTGPKYLNSPETRIYHKSDVLFGLDLAKQAIRQDDAVVIMEGNLDVIASHKVSVENVVASSGTAITESQLRQLHKRTKQLLFCLDRDDAGFAAAQRGLRLAQRMGFHVRVIEIPEDLGKDPDDVVQNKPEAWKACVEDAVPVMDFFFNRFVNDLDVSDVASRREFIQRMLSELVYVQDPVERSHWLQKVGDVSRTELSVLEQTLASTKKEDRIAVEESTSAERPSNSVIGPRDKALLWLVGLSLQSPECAKQVVNEVKDEHVEGPYASVYKIWKTLYTANNSPTSAQNTLYSRLRDQLQLNDQAELLSTLDATVLKIEELTQQHDSAQLREELAQQLSVLQSEALRTRQAHLEADIRQAELSGDSERAKELLQAYSELLS